MKHESFDQVFQLGMVAVKVIVLFLLVMVSVLLGIIWYQSESEIMFLSSPASSPIVETPVGSDVSEEMDESESENEGEITVVIVSVDTVESVLTVQSSDGLTTLEIAYDEDTEFFTQVIEDTSMMTPIMPTDIEAGVTVQVTLTAESLSEGASLVAETVVVQE